MVFINYSIIFSLFETWTENSDFLNDCLSIILFLMIQAPSTMKSVVQAAWLWTVAFGNLIVIIVAEGKSEGLSQVSCT
jgi:hypothetical protein